VALALLLLYLVGQLLEQDNLVAEVIISLVVAAVARVRQQ
jgi:hypothetical protein